MRAVMRPILLAAAALACGGGCAAPPVLPPAAIAPGSPYFTLGGETRFWTGRTPRAKDLDGFRAHFRDAAVAGERLVRIHLDHAFPESKAAAGELPEAWCRSWDAVFDAAAAEGLYVLPVLGVWGRWNDGSTGSRWHSWDRNPWNRANGGPAERPNDLYGDTACQRLYLDWLGRAVARFARHGNLMGWEIFSEVDLVTGTGKAGVPAVVAFVERAAAVTRANDSLRRPVGVSLSGVRSWPELWSSPGVDFVQIHPYPGKRRGADLFVALRDHAAALRAFGKPVMVGEAGLDQGPPVDTADALPRAFVGYRQGVWAALMGGYANGGMFWWISGYGPPERDRLFPGLCGPASRFAAGFDVAGASPLPVAGSGVDAMALGGPAGVAVYVRDPACLHPDWPARDVSGARVVLRLPWPGPSTAEFLRAETLEPAGAADLPAAAGDATVDLPAFREDLVIRIRPRA